MIKEVKDNSANSPRLTELQKCLDSWLDSYDHDIANERVNLILLAYDKKYDHVLKLALTGQNDPQSDICDTFSQSLGKLNDKLSVDIFNGTCQYLANIFANYPELEKSFNDNVKKMKENI